MKPTDRALLDLLAVERGGMMPLRTGAGDNGVYEQLHARKLVRPDPKSGRYVLTAAGREQAEAAQSQLRGGGGTTLRTVRR